MHFISGFLLNVPDRSMEHLQVRHRNESGMAMAGMHLQLERRLLVRPGVLHSRIRRTTRSHRKSLAVIFPDTPQSWTELSFSLPVRRMRPKSSIL